jgi:hypothetical protein
MIVQRKQVLLGSSAPPRGDAVSDVTQSPMMPCG